MHINKKHFPNLVLLFDYCLYQESADSFEEATRQFLTFDHRQVQGAINEATILNEYPDSLVTEFFIKNCDFSIETSGHDACKIIISILS